MRHWIHTITKQNGWDLAFDCPMYKIVIDEMPAGTRTSKAWNVGDEMLLCESKLEPYNG